MEDNFARFMALDALDKAESKVDKIDGKGLSSNDFTDKEKEKLSKITNPMILKGRVDTVEDLPNDAEAGWVFFVGTESDSEFSEYCFTDNGKWEFIGFNSIDLSDCIKKSDIIVLTQSEYDSLTEKTAMYYFIKEE